MFWETFETLCFQFNKTPNAVCKDLGFSSATATHWKHGKFPGAASLEKIALYFNVSIDYLLGKTDQKEKPAETIGEIQAAYDHASEEIKAAVRKLLDV